MSSKTRKVRYSEAAPSFLDKTRRRHVDQNGKTVGYSEAAPSFLDKTRRRAHTSFGGGGDGSSDGFLGSIIMFVSIAPIVRIFSFACIGWLMGGVICFFAGPDGNSHEQTIQLLDQAWDAGTHNGFYIGALIGVILDVITFTTWAKSADNKTLRISGFVVASIVAVVGLTLTIPNIDHSMPRLEPYVPTQAQKQKKPPPTTTSENQQIAPEDKGENLPPDGITNPEEALGPERLGPVPEENSDTSAELDEADKLIKEIREAPKEDGMLDDSEVISSSTADGEDEVEKHLRRFDEIMKGMHDGESPTTAHPDSKSKPPYE